jgi:hypothetical protein
MSFILENSGVPQETSPKVVLISPARSQTFSQKSTFDTKRLDYLIKEFPKYKTFNSLTEIDFKLLHANKGNKLIYIDIACFCINLSVVLVYIYEVIYKFTIA